MLHDLRLACRQLLQRPGFSAVAILTLAVGLGVNTIAFSAVNALLLKTRAGADVEGAGWVLVSGGTGLDEGIAFVEFERLTAATRGALATAVEGRLPIAWRHDGMTEPVWALIVSAQYLSLLNAQPLAGRVLGSADIGAAPGVVVSERFWRERLGARALGSTTITLNGIDCAVVGVLPDTFDGPGGLFAPQVWLPLEARRTLQLPARLDSHDERWLYMIGVLQNGATVGDVEARLAAGAAAIAAEWPKTHTGRRARFRLIKDKHPEVASMAWVVASAMAAVGMVLLIACFNVANLLLARAIERQREMGIRTAIGASRWRLMRQQITEGLVFAALAATVAGVLAMWSQDLLSAFAIPIPMPQRLNVRPDATVIAFVAIGALVAGVLPGVAPAVRAARVDVVRALSATGAGAPTGRPSAARRVLVALQVAGSTVFLVVAALFVQTYVWSINLDPGFEDERAIVFAFDPSMRGYDAPRAQLAIARVLDTIRGAPGVAAAAVADRIPFYVGYARQTLVATHDEPCSAGGCPAVATYAVGPDFFRTMGITLLAGREFDSPISPHSVIVNRALAGQLSASAAPIGRTLRLGPAGDPHAIVGVVENTMQRGFQEAQLPAIYLPLARPDYEAALTVVVRTHGDPAPIIGDVARAVHVAEPDIAPIGLTTMRERLRMPRWPIQTGSAIFGICGALAVLLATIGLAAVMSHAVGQRRREFGVRLSVGATPRRLMRDVLGGSVTLVLPGVAAGLIAAALSTRTMRALLVGIDVAHPSTYIAVALTQVAIALLAAAAPARRAVRINPLASLRSD